MSYITFDDAVKILEQEMKYPSEKALHYVKKFDKNNDGRLSKEEFDSFRCKIEETKKTLVPKFKEYDQDGNNYITLTEASQILMAAPFNFPRERVSVLLHRFDTDGNGKLDIEEFADFYAEAKATKDQIATKFNEMDLDGNGYLSPDEVIRVIMDMLGMDEASATGLMKVFDTNQDGKLDKAEFVQMYTKYFG